jgi:hypothetical protein
LIQDSIDDRYVFIKERSRFDFSLYTSITLEGYARLTARQNFLDFILDEEIMRRDIIFTS